MAARRKKPDSKALALAKEKLESSGLDIKDAEVLGIHPLSGAETQKLHKSFKPLCSLKIDYIGPDGKPMSDWPKAPPFYRVRYLETQTGFDAIADKKPPRYVQEPNTAPVAYYPANCKDWLEIIKDPGEPIIITEGELKAAKACKEGYPTIGLGGVYNWRSYKLGIDWLESLSLVDWVRRNVYIVFDSDYQTNPMVCTALRDLANAFHMRGSFVHLVTLPQLDNLDKVGLDDFLTFAGPSANQMFERLLSNAEPLGLTAPLWGFNDKYVYVQNPGLVVNQATMQKSSPSAFTEHLQAAVRYQERRLKQDGNISFETVSAASAWLKWPLRTEVTKLTYRPGAGKFVSEPAPMFNIWPGWGVEPKKGSVKLFTKLIDHVFTGAEAGAKEWFLKWCAYPLQNPGTKMFSSAVIHGVRHGTGKSLIGYTLGAIYGENFTEINQMDLHNSFNEWAEGKQFVMGDDVTGSNKRQDADYLKKMITQKELRVNAKFVATYVVPDCINYFFTANHPDSFFLEDDDRRFFIHEVRVGKMEQEFYRTYVDWLYNKGGASAIFQYMLDMDLGDFDPAAQAFKTMAKERMIANVQSDLAGWVRQLIATPDHTLVVGGVALNKDLFTSKELLNFYDPEGKTGTTANGLGRELARAGVSQVYGGRPIRLSDGSQYRYYAVRNPDKWLACDNLKAIADHIENAGTKDRIVRKKKY